VSYDRRRGATVMNNLWIIQYCSTSRKSELSSDWHTKGFGRTSDTVGSGSRWKEERVGVGWTNRRQEGIWRHRERKLRWKVRSSHLPRLF